MCEDPIYHAWYMRQQSITPPDDNRIFCRKIISLAIIKIKTAITMASSQDDLKSDDSYASDSSEDNQIDAQDRAPKRRRLSESSTDSYVAPAPLPTLSRIKKKDDTKKPESNDDENPVTIKDALEIGLQAEQSTFGALDVSPWLVGSLTTMAVRRPTAIQKACIPEILKGRDCIGGSRTGSGKTIAFAVPIMQIWAKDPFGIFALVLTPTRYVHLRRITQQSLLLANILSLSESLRYKSSSSSRLSRHRRA